MCRETELEWSLGGADLDDTLASLRHRTTGKVEEGLRRPGPPNVLGVIAEEPQRTVVQPILPTRKTTSSAPQGPRLLPYFPKHGITSPPTPQSLARNGAVATQSIPSPPPPAKATARNPSQRASANSTLAPSKKPARNPSPTPVSRPTSRNPTSEKVSKPTPTTNSSTGLASRATARNPSPTPATRISATRNPSPTPASRASARTPSPTPAPRTSTSACNPSPSPATRATPVQSSAKNPVAPSSTGKTITSTRRPASPTVTRRNPSSPLYNENGNRVYTADSARKPASTMSSSPGSSVDSSGELSPRSALDVNKALRMSINRSLKSEGLGVWSPESYSPVKKLTLLELQAQKKERIAGYGRKAGSVPKSGRVACEGMLPSSPLKPETRKRCHWVTPESEPGLVAYHDEVWGVPVHDDKVLFELLVLEGAQAELTRPQILSITEYFRQVFRGFDPEIVATFDEKKVAALKADEIIRQPEAKLRAVIDNAKQVLKIVEEFGSFDNYLWNFVGFKPIVNTYRIFTQIPVKSSKAETLSKDLMRRGFRYVGPTTVYSFMQAAGMVNDHLVSCYRHGECCEI